MTPANDNVPLWPRGLSRSRAACYVGQSVTMFNKMVDKGEMPKPKMMYGRLIWDKTAVDKAFSDWFGEDSGTEEIIDFAA